MTTTRLSDLRRATMGEDMLTIETRTDPNMQFARGRQEMLNREEARELYNLLKREFEDED